MTSKGTVSFIEPDSGADTRLNVHLQLASRAGSFKINQSTLKRLLAWKSKREWFQPSWVKLSHVVYLISRGERHGEKGERLGGGWWRGWDDCERQPVETENTQEEEKEEAEEHHRAYGGRPCRGI